MDSHWKDELVVLSVEVVELVEPQLLDVFGIDPAVAVRRLLDEPNTIVSSRDHGCK